MTVSDMIRAAVRTAATTAAATAKTAASQKLGGGSGSSGSENGKVTTSYTEKIDADAGLSDPAKAQIQSYRDQAKAGLISWDQANQAANAVRMGQGGYTVDKQGNATYSQPPSSQYGSFQEFVDAMGYGDISNQTQKAIKAAVDQAVSGYNRQIETTNQDSDELARQAYVAKMMGQKNLDQQMAANGYAGGMADSQRIATETNYENTLADIEQQRLDTIRELEAAIEQAKLSGDMQAAQELSGYLQQLSSQWASYVQNQQQMNNQNYWNQQQMNQTNQQMEAQNKEAAYTKALDLISQGFMPDDETLTAAGISKLEAQSRLSQIRSQLAGETAGTTGTKRTPAYTPVRNPEQDTPVGDPEGTTGLGADAMRKLLNRMSISLSEETPENAVNAVQKLIDMYWDSMTASEQNQVNELLKRYGAI